jgi:chemotaxis protein CheX
MKQEYLDAFLAPAQMLWESELSEPLQLIEAKTATDYKAPENVTAVIGISGQLTGNVLYEFGNAPGLAIASSMMGEPLEEHDEISMSALGELTNMISGSAATNLSEHGISCDITPPEMNSAVASAGTEIIAALTSSFGLFNIRFNLAEGA